MKITINARELKDILTQLKPFMSTEETRYYLRGVYIHTTIINDKNDCLLSLVATNGHILMIRKAGCSVIEHSDVKISHILPAASVNLFIKALKQSRLKTIPVILTFTAGEKAGGAVKLDCYDEQITARCIDGTFPDYVRVMPDYVPEGTTYTPPKPPELPAEAAPPTKPEPKHTTGLMGYNIKALAAGVCRESYEVEFFGKLEPIRFTRQAFTFDGVKHHAQTIIVMPCRT